MASTARIDELKKKFDENPRRYFAPLANEFRKAGEIEQAIMICEEFLPQQPGHMSGHIVYGQALYEAGRLPESRTVFETALGLDPENLIALRHLGDIARGQQDPEAARSWYVRVLDADPRNEEIQSLIAGLDGGGDGGSGQGTTAPATEASPPDAEQHLVIEKEVEPFDGAVTREVAARPPIDPSLADTAPIGVPIIPPPAPAAAPALLDGFSMHGFDDALGDAGTSHAAPAPGFESTEFEPPSEHVPAAELDASLESGIPSFASPEHAIEALDGLQGSGGQPHAPATDGRPATGIDDFAPLDLDGGLIIPSEGDPLARPSVAAPAPKSFDDRAPVDDLIDLDLEMPQPVQAAAPRDAAHTAGPDESAVAPVAADNAPLELPPQVIAAEAELIDAGETPQPPIPADEDVGAPEVAARPPFVTETMAELYLAQGFREQALSVYSDLLAASPNDERLAGIVASLTPTNHVEDEGPNVRDFLARMASRRPGRAQAALEPPAYDDFAPEPTAADDDTAAEAYGESPAVEPEPVEAFATSAAVAPALERSAAMQQPDGSIDALFGNRAAGTSEDSAAAALAQAFGGAAAEAVPPIPGRPAHAATGELSLDSVFRDGPARPARSSQSFSFDQFFAGGEDRTARTSPPRGVATSQGQEAPAERGADDIEQFNSWLQGLKQR